jgi:hypothetical protein
MTKPNKQSVHEELGQLDSRIAFNKRVAWLLVIGGGLAAVWGLWVFRKDLSSEGNLSSLGSYLQGAVGSLWALAGLMFIYVAFLGQKQQLLLQREEMEGQEIQFQLQQNSIKRQSFESAFFQMVNLHNQLVNELRAGNRTGKDYFQDLYSSYGGRFDQWLRRKGIASPNPQHFDDERLAIEFYEDDVYKGHEPYLGPYFRNLYHIFKFVKSSDVEPKRQYTSLMRAQLSRYELFFLFYNCLGSHGKGFKPLVEEFGLLEHLDTKALLSETHRLLYAESAFK